MNQKIKEIAQKSGISFLYDYSEDGHAVVLNLKDLEQFAKNLIDECTNIIEKYNFDPASGSCEIKDILVEEIENITKNIQELTPLPEEPEHECWDYDEVTKDMVRYDESLGDNQNYVNISEIVVPSEWDKEQLLRAFKYLHNNRIIDTDFLAVNTLIHLYECPERITLKYPDAIKIYHETRLKG